MNPLHSIIEGSFLSSLDPNKLHNIYTDIIWKNRDIPAYVKVLGLEDLITTTDDHNTRCIVITMKLTHQDILIIDQKDTRPKLRISLHPGIMSSIYKYRIEEDDITTLLSKGYSIWEAYDQASFFHYINKSSGYIRVIDTFLPDGISRTHKRKDADKDFVIVDNHDHYHDTVIITTGASLVTVSQSIHHGEEHTAFTCIVQGGWSNNINNQTVIEHIRHASHVIIIIEHKATEAIWMYYDVLIKQYNPQIKLSYIFPQYHLLTSILPDYAYELSGFDSQRIREYLQNN